MMFVFFGQSALFLINGDRGPRRRPEDDSTIFFLASTKIFLENFFARCHLPPRANITVFLTISKSSLCAALFWKGEVPPASVDSVARGPILPATSIGANSEYTFTLPTLFSSFFFHLNGKKIYWSLLAIVYVRLFDTERGIICCLSCRAGPEISHF